MSESREELIEAMRKAAYASHELVGGRRCACHMWEADRGVGDGAAFVGWGDHLESVRLDALLAHPVAVLIELENANCPECVGYATSVTPEGLPVCSACSGSGVLGREGVLALLGMEQVGWGTHWPDGVWYMVPPNLKADSDVPVFASRVAVPPKETNRVSLRDDVQREVARLRDGSPQYDLARCSRWEWRRKAWLDGVAIAREVAADHLEDALRRDAADELTAETERLGLYDDSPAVAVPPKESATDE